MRFSVQYPHPTFAVPRGKRKEHAFYLKGTCEIEVPDVAAHEMEFIASFEIGGESHSVYRLGEAYYTAPPTPIATGDIVATVKADLSKAASSVMTRSYAGAGVEFLKTQSFFMANNVLSELPTSEEIEFRDLNELVESGVQRMLSEVRARYVVRDGVILVACQQPRLELIQIAPGACTLSVSSGPFVDPGADYDGEYGNANAFPVSYFRIEEEAAALEFAHDAYADGSVTLRYADIALGDAPETEELDTRSVAALAARLERSTRMALVGTDSAPVFAASVLDDLSTEALTAYRELRQAVRVLVAGGQPDTEGLVEVLERFRDVPELRVGEASILPLAALTERWHDRRVSVDIGTGPALRR